MIFFVEWLHDFFVRRGCVLFLWKCFFRGCVILCCVILCVESLHDFLCKEVFNEKKSSHKKRFW